MNFPCTGCGACCRQLPSHSTLNTGDGTCRHLDPVTSRCAVYAERPLICRVDDMYAERLSSKLSPRVYYLVQAEGCVALDERNADMPAAVLTMLDASQPGSAQELLSEEELNQGLQVVLAEAAPLVNQM